jgi:hypothetical protein
LAARRGAEQGQEFGAERADLTALVGDPVPGGTRLPLLLDSLEQDLRGRQRCSDLFKLGGGASKGAPF